MKVELEKGRTAVHLDVADERVLGIVTGRDIPPLSREKVAAVIHRGIRDTAPPNIAQEKTAVIIPDDTRLWARGDLFVPGIVNTLTELGVPLEQIVILIALGTHADIPENRFAQLAGPFCAANVTILNSANRDKSRLVPIGKTGRGTQVTVTKEAWEADHIIIFGGLLHHLIAGFGGGRKYILPGITGYETIQQNHSLAFRPDGSAHPLVRQAQLAGNPVHEDMTEAAGLFLKDKTACYVAVAANGEGDIFHTAAGDLHTTFTDGCDILNHACCPDLSAKGDFALISAGGFRTDGQLYQATKALFNAVAAVKEGGDILFVAACGDGVGNPVFENALRTYRGKGGALGKALARSFDMPSYVAFRVMDLLDRYRITLVSDLDGASVNSLGFSHTDDLTGYLRNLTGKGYIIPFAENILPRVGQPGTKECHG